VYHDAILTPWRFAKGQGVPKKDSGHLHGLTSGGLPYMSSLDPNEAELTQVRTMCALHQRVGLLEMTNHEFLDKNYRKQRTTFADGTTVTTDLDAGRFEILPELPVPRTSF